MGGGGRVGAAALSRGRGAAPGTHRGAVAVAGSGMGGLANRRSKAGAAIGAVRLKRGADGGLRLDVDDEDSVRDRGRRGDHGKGSAMNVVLDSGSPIDLREGLEPFDSSWSPPRQRSWVQKRRAGLAGTGCPGLTSLEFVSNRGGDETRLAEVSVSFAFRPSVLNGASFVGAFNRAPEGQVLDEVMGDYVSGDEDDSGSDSDPGSEGDGDFERDTGNDDAEGEYIGDRRDFDFWEKADFSSRVTMEHIIFQTRHFPLEDFDFLKLPTPAERSFDPPPGYYTVYLEYFKWGLTLPLSHLLSVTP